jgi:acyl-CoA synthetase (AMP-forming)/AMP-acid ligase II
MFAKALLLSWVLVLAGCTCHRQVAAVGVPPAATGEIGLVKTELYLGLSRRDGTVVSASEWGEFLEAVVTPRFPEGLSVVDVAGQWRDDGGRVCREPSKLLILIHRPGPASDGAIEEIRALYKQRFGQESVLRTDQPVAARF